jgi:lipopolysaccharide/colanic/teichoic acid biosynthesis glycosyltransferase
VAAQPAPIQTAIPVNERYLRAKRLFDVVVTLLILIPFGLIAMGIIAVLIKLDSPGPVLFRQTRFGLYGAKFEMLKFRSMYRDSDDTLHREATGKHMGGESISNDPQKPFKIKNDPRITRVGRLLRKTSLDELPQFFNVLRGEMSLVGPRPPVEYEYVHYSPHAHLRMQGMPGLTGSWQVYARNTATFQEMVDLDIAYLERQSLLYDVKLIVLTIPAALRGG